MDFIDEVIAVSEADASAAALRIHGELGYCVGISSGANTLAAARPRSEGSDGVARLLRSLRIDGPRAPRCGKRHLPAEEPLREPLGERHRAMT